MTNAERIDAVVVEIQNAAHEIVRGALELEAAARHLREYLRERERLAAAGNKQP